MRISCSLNIWTLPPHPPIPGFCCCFEVTVFCLFVCLVLIEYVVYSVLTEHVQCTEPHRGIQHFRNAFIIIMLRWSSGMVKNKTYLHLMYCFMVCIISKEGYQVI